MKTYLITIRHIIILMLLIIVGQLNGQQQLVYRYPLWEDNLPFPAQEKIPFPAGVVDNMIHRAGSDNYSFLHDAAIVEHKNVLYAAWYNCPSGEMEGMSLIRGRRSTDHGLTWSGTEVIASDKKKRGNMYVPVTFFSWQGVLYAFISNIISEGYRNLLTLAVTKPGKKQFSRVWKI